MTGKSYHIGVIGGDGTGPEVIREGVKVVEAAARKHAFKIEWVDYDLGGERYKRTGEILPDSIVPELKKLDAIYLGAIGHPDVKPGILEKGILLRLRFDLDQYINLRPVKLYPNVETPLKDKGPADIDYVVVRENTGDLYTGIGGVSMKGTPQEVAVQSAVYNRFQVDRCLRYAFDLTRKRKKNMTLALCGKTNVLTYVYDLWERAFHEMGAKDYPEIKREYYHVDATCMWMVKNPEWFDVIVTGNMFGDIITDLGAITQGGMGIAPIGGSAPKYTGKNVINPMAAICAGAMMLDTIGEHAASSDIEQAVIKSLESGKIKSLAAGKMGMGTTEVGDFIASNI
jgi:3-isopropylmalate dehydrogenase